MILDCFLSTKKGYELEDPYISTARILNGRLMYEVLLTVGRIPTTISSYEETYEEALEALKAD